MAIRKLDFSAQGWLRVFGVTALGTLGCILAALYVDSFSFLQRPAEERLYPILIDILLPLCLALPLLFFFMNKLRQLAIAQHALQVLASTDSLTAVLNRGAFTMLVDAYLERASATVPANIPAGALLVVDADHFKAINDSFGHEQGDVALRLIAETIKGELRGSDLVGRIGGEEFGVFLPGASPELARRVADRIRERVAEAVFRPAGKQQGLSVSIGGASFDRPVLFSDLYRAADARLYKAKAAGRNRTDLMPVALAA